jgi:hypothetical protein
LICENSRGHSIEPGQLELATWEAADPAPDDRECLADHVLRIAERGSSPNRVGEHTLLVISK